MRALPPRHAVAVLSALALSACSPEAQPESCAEPLYGGKATDEA